MYIYVCVCLQLTSKEKDHVVASGVLMHLIKVRPPLHNIPLYKPPP